MHYTDIGDKFPQPAILKRRVLQSLWHLTLKNGRVNITKDLVSDPNHSMRGVCVASNKPHSEEDELAACNLSGTPKHTYLSDTQMSEHT